MKIFLVRHGQTNLNALRVQQHPGAKLSEYGIRQAKNLAKRFYGMKIDLIISSTTERAVQTARIINEVVKKKIIYTKLLNEKKAPSESLGKGLESGEIIEMRKRMIRHIGETAWHYSDEENYADLFRRVSRLLDYLSRRKEESIIVVSHSYVLRMALYVMLSNGRFDSKRFYKLFSLFRTDNTGIMELEINEEGEWKVLAWNDHAHIKQ